MIAIVGYNSKGLGKQRVAAAFGGEKANTVNNKGTAEIELDIAALNVGSTA